MWPGGKFSDALAEKRYNSYMHRSWAIAAMVAVLLTVSAEAQRHVGMSAGGGSHFVSSSHGSMGGSSRFDDGEPRAYVWQRSASGY